MAKSSIQLATLQEVITYTDGSGKHTQAFVLGNAAGTATAPIDGTTGLAVNVTNASLATSASFSPAASGGYSSKRVYSAASNNAQVLQSGACQLYLVSGICRAAHPVTLKFYNKSSTPTPGSDAVVFAVTFAAGLPLVVPVFHGLPFAAGMAIAIVLEEIDTGTQSAVALGDLSLSILLKT